MIGKGKIKKIPSAFYHYRATLPITLLSERNITMTQSTENKTLTIGGATLNVTVFGKTNAGKVDRAEAEAIAKAKRKERNARYAAGRKAKKQQEAESKPVADIGVPTADFQVFRKGDTQSIHYYADERRIVEQIDDGKLLPSKEQIEVGNACLSEHYFTTCQRIGHKVIRKWASSKANAPDDRRDEQGVNDVRQFAGLAILYLSYRYGKAFTESLDLFQDCLEKQKWDVDGIDRAFGAYGAVARIAKRKYLARNGKDTVYVRPINGELIDGNACLNQDGSDNPIKPIIDRLSESDSMEFASELIDGLDAVIGLTLLEHSLLTFRYVHRENTIELGQRFFPDSKDPAQLANRKLLRLEEKIRQAFQDHPVLKERFAECI